MGTNWFDQFSFKVDQNKREIKWGCYVIVLTGLGYAFRSIRPFAKFQSAREIPQTFIDKQIKLNGYVTSVEESCTLRIDHNPIFGLRWRSPSTSGLAVVICGVDVSIRGVDWLKTNLLGQCVHFVLLKKQESKVICNVYWNRKDVAEELLRSGLATVAVIDFDLERNKWYCKYYRRLLTLEDKAEKKKMGLWAHTKLESSESLFKKFVQFFNVFYRFKK